MSEARKKVAQRLEERLARLEALSHEKVPRWHLFHLHHAVNKLADDHLAADLHLDDFDRHELGREFPEIEADHVPTADEIRTRFDMVAGGLL